MSGEVRLTSVLLVDDEPLVCRAYQRVLERAGHMVACVGDVATACALLAGDGHFDVVVTDVTLGGGSGFEVLAIAKRAQPVLPVILISGLADPAVARRAYDCGALRYLVKPVSIADLRAAIADACGGLDRRTSGLTTSPLAAPASSAG